MVGSVTRRANLLWKPSSVVSVAPAAAVLLAEHFCFYAGSSRPVTPDATAAVLDPITDSFDGTANLSFLTAYQTARLCSHRRVMLKQPCTLPFLYLPHVGDSNGICNLHCQSSIQNLPRHPKVHFTFASLCHQ